MVRLRTKSDDYEIELNDSDTANAIYLALPFEGYANLWGDEIYFEIPVHMGPEDRGKREMDVGEVAYWPSGSALCLFFGPTPVSIGNKPMAYSPVNPVGKVLGDPRRLERIGDRMKVILELASTTHK